MWPIIRVRNERELGNAAAAGAVCDPEISGDTFRWYSSQGMPARNPAPKHVEFDRETGQKMYWLDEVRAWDAQRPGRGNWEGLGAKYRRAIIARRVCPTCHQMVNIDDHAEYQRHFVGRKRCPTGETRCPDVEPVVVDDDVVPA